MAANHPAAVRAFPFFLLYFQKIRHPARFNITKIFNKARPEMCLIPPVDLLQPFAGEVFAFIAELRFAIQEHVASLFDKSAYLVPGPAAFTVRHPDPPALHVVL